MCIKHSYSLLSVLKFCICVIYWIKNISQKTHVLKCGALGSWLDYRCANLINELIIHKLISESAVRTCSLFRRGGHWSISWKEVCCLKSCLPGSPLLSLSLSLSGRHEVSNCPLPWSSSMMFLPPSRWPWTGISKITSHNKSLFL